MEDEADGEYGDGFEEAYSVGDDEAEGDGAYDAG